MFGCVFCKDGWLSRRGACSWHGGWRLCFEELFTQSSNVPANLGNLEFVGTLTDGSLHYSSPNRDKTYTIRLSFAGTKMNVTEENTFGIYGHNVRFEGEYERHEAILKQ